MRPWTRTASRWPLFRPSTNWLWRKRERSGGSVRASHDWSARPDGLAGARGDLRTFTRAVVDAGADLVLGHGPHVVRGMEVYKNRLIVYSLGNFAFYRFPFAGPTALSLVLETNIDPDDGSFVSGRIHPLIQQGQDGPRPDRNNTVINVVRQLSKEDFGPTAVNVAADGTISAP